MSEFLEEILQTTYSDYNAIKWNNFKNENI